MVLAHLAGGAPVAAHASDNQVPATDGSPANTIFAWSAYIQPPAPSDDPELRNLFTAFAESLGSDAFPEAEIAAKQMVEEVSHGGVASLQRARALHNLAVAQRVGGNYEAASQNYIASLDVISKSTNNLSAELILPMRGLAETYLASGRTEQGITLLEQAQHVSHVNFGPHNLDQLPILETELDFFVEQGDTASALDLTDQIYTLFARRYERNDAEMLPVLYRQARIYDRLNLPDKELDTWRRILDVKEAHVSENDPVLIEPHTRIAYILVPYMRRDSFRSVSSSGPERHLKRALWIAENSADPDWRVTTECLLSLADFYTLFDMKGRARRYYAVAWELLSSNDSYLPLRDARFAAPVPLLRSVPDPYATFEHRPGEDPAMPNDYVQGEMTIAFTIDDRGRTRDVEIVAAEPENFALMENRLRKAVDYFVYRPRFVDGAPVATTGQEHEFRFYYLPSDYRASLDRNRRRNH